MKSNESVGQDLSQQLVYYLIAQIEQNIQRSGSNLIDDSFTKPSLVTLFPTLIVVFMAYYEVCIV